MRQWTSEDGAIRVASLGGGVNSAAMLIGMHERGERCDLVLFADTGAEWPETYDFLKVFDGWLQAHNMPPVTTVRANRKYPTIIAECLGRRQWPSVCYGWKTCSQGWKLEPQIKYVNHWQPAIDAWAKGQKVTRLIGYDADEPQRAKPFDDPKYQNRYPLIEWDWGRDECLAAIKRAGLPMPRKSACTVCASTKKAELWEMKRNHPDKLAEALDVEDAGLERATSGRGLGRHFNWRKYLAGGEQLTIPLEVETPCECYDGCAIPEAVGMFGGGK